MTTTLRYVNGLPELERALAQLPVNLEKKILRGALRAAAGVILAEARSRVPVKSGRLAKTLRISTGVRRGVVTAKVVAGNRKQGVFYAHILEGGAKPHIIAAKRGKLLRLQGNVYKRRVFHPGMSARPFLRPALESGANAALEVMAQYIRQRLDQAVK